MSHSSGVWRLNETFDSFDEAEKARLAHEERNSCQWRIFTSKTNKTCYRNDVRMNLEELGFNPALKWNQATFLCPASMKYQKKKHRENWHNIEMTTDCRADVRLRVTENHQQLQIWKMIELHDHSQVPNSEFDPSMQKEKKKEKGKRKQKACTVTTEEIGASKEKPGDLENVSNSLAALPNLLSEEALTTKSTRSSYMKEESLADSEQLNSMGLCSIIKEEIDIPEDTHETLENVPSPLASSPSSEQALATENTKNYMTIEPIKEEPTMDVEQLNSASLCSSPSPSFTAKRVDAAAISPKVKLPTTVIDQSSDLKESTCTNLSMLPNVPSFSSSSSRVENASLRDRGTSNLTGQGVNTSPPKMVSVGTNTDLIGPHYSILAAMVSLSSNNDLPESDWNSPVNELSFCLSPSHPLYDKILKLTDSSTNGDSQSPPSSRRPRLESPLIPPIPVQMAGAAAHVKIEIKSPATENCQPRLSTSPYPIRIKRSPSQERFGSVPISEESADKVAKRSQKSSTKKKTKETSNSKPRRMYCFQCHGYGHNYPDCPYEAKHLFCTCCGKWEVTLETCARQDERHLRARAKLAKSGAEKQNSTQMQPEKKNNGTDESSSTAVDTGSSQRGITQSEAAVVNHSQAPVPVDLPPHAFVDYRYNLAASPNVTNPVEPELLRHKPPAREHGPAERPRVAATLPPTFGAQLPRTPLREHHRPDIYYEMREYSRPERLPRMREHFHPYDYYNIRKYPYPENFYEMREYVPREDDYNMKKYPGPKILHEHPAPLIDRSVPSNYILQPPLRKRMRSLDAYDQFEELYYKRSR